MDTKDVAAILTAVAWPITILIVVLYFRTPLNSFMKKLADSVTSLKITVPNGPTIEATVEQAKSTLHEIIADTMKGLEDPDLKLFQKIDAADGRQTVLDLIPGFVENSKEHDQLRKLRDRKLIRPFEDGSWDSQKHPIVTRFAHAVQKLDPKLLSSPTSHSG